MTRTREHKSMIEDLPADAPDPLAQDFPFDHPLWIVYSSGTTDTKGMVHGQQ